MNAPTPVTGGSPGLPRIRVVDAVASAHDDALTAADGRLIEFTVGELERLVRLLGGEGLEAFCAYLKVLRKEAGTDGRPILVVDDFSGRWLLENTTLTRNAAYRAQNVLEASGLLQRLVTQPGQGARGKQRAVVNPQLVLIPGGADGDTKGLRTRKPGRQRRVSTAESPAAAFPVSPEPGNRETGLSAPVSHQPGNRESGPVSRFPDTWETGNQGAASPQVSPGFPDSQTVPAALTSSETAGVVQELFTSATGSGLLRSALVATLLRDRAHVEERLYAVFNVSHVTERAEALLVPCRLTGPATERARGIVRYLADLLTGELDPAKELVKLGVHGRPKVGRERLAEQLAVGIVVGLGMSSVDQWGAWLWTATKPNWQPKPNTVYNRFVEEVERLAEDQVRHRARNSGLPPAESPAAAPTAAGAAPRDVAAPASPEPAPVLEELDEQVLAAHLVAAQREFPQFARGPKKDDPVWQQRVVRMYLSLGHGVVSEQEAG